MLNSGSHGHSCDEALSEYVAHLQLHMALQARNLVPHLSSPNSPRSVNGGLERDRNQLLHDTQAQFEKLISRQ
ncbi:hypothetical protein [Thalassoporum mexicanum]|uniref:hypothetical protein n=1 Tax=Thalassoporum mexicanum TaxID=3457544 RepID=UPI0018DE6888|nr:hypothetical protein [Pseudanabaena sp. PCC 7367]